METIAKHFSQLSAEELLEIYKLRVSVFIVEQNCPYQDVDDADKCAYHIWIQDDDKITAYARVLPPNTVFPTVSIGRVLSVKRRQGCASQVLKKAIEIAKDKFFAKIITIEAQVYARTLYEKSGFHQISDEFLEDGIPHILMQMEL